MNNMDNPEYFISWGSERHVPLRRFEDLQPNRHDLVRYYGEVLETAQTFTQHFSKQPLKSYDMERSLRKNMGCDPSCLDEDENSTSICWLDIVRHGDFQQQNDGCYHCFIQGKVFVHDQELHNRVDFCRSHALQISNSGPSYADVEREAEATKEILTDISKELRDVLKCAYFSSTQESCASGNLTGTDTKGLGKLQRALKIRDSNLQSLRGPTVISPTTTSPPQCLTPHEPDTTVSVERLRASSSAQSSGSETTSDDDHDKPMAMGCSSSSEDSSEDESEDEATEDKGTGDDSSKNDTSQLRNNNSDNGGSAAPDNAMVVSLNPLSSRTLSSRSLMAEENIISTGHASLLGDIGDAVSVNTASSRNSSSVSSPTENENRVAMDLVSSQNAPQMDTHLPLPKSPIRQGSNTLIESEEGPSPRAAKRRRYIGASRAQKKVPMPGRKSSPQERSNSVAWLKAHSDKRWTQGRFELEYCLKFGRKRAFKTLTDWMDKENSQEESSHIVVLKVPIPCLHEASLNDNSS